MICAAGADFLKKRGKKASFMVDGQVEKLVLNFFLGYTSHTANSEG